MVSPGMLIAQYPFKKASGKDILFQVSRSEFLKKGNLT
jgi:hypothetical protein